MKIDVKEMAEKIRNMLSNQPVSDINVVVHDGQIFASAKPHPETGARSLSIAVRIG